MSVTLTQAEIDQLTKEAARQQNFADALAAAAPAKQARAAELAVADGAFKKFFDYYNDDIIGKYEAERKAINGVYIVNPITEADVTGPANIDGSVRTTPTLPATDIVRVTEFDGGGTTTTTVNEKQHIIEAAAVDWPLRNGVTVSGYTPGGTASITDVLEINSTEIRIQDVTNPLNIQVDDIIVVAGIAASGTPICKITSVISSTGTNFHGEFEYIVPPIAQVPFGSTCETFTGFSDAERDIKTSSLAREQNIMDYYVSVLETALNNRLSRITEQLTALNANQDPDGTAAIATAVTNATTAQNWITNYLLTTDISDSGLLSMVTEGANRDTYLNTRVTEINAAFTGQTENYYDRRYTIANDRANTSRGTLRLKIATETSANDLTSYATNAQDAVDAINAILP